MGALLARKGEAEMASNFYETMPIFDNFAQAVRPENYRPLPDDWIVGFSDVVGSTQMPRGGVSGDSDVTPSRADLACRNRRHPEIELELLAREDRHGGKRLGRRGRIGARNREACAIAAKDKRKRAG